ncbi:MAG: glycogen debranching enzyme family protein [Phycisphaerales bacterium]|nr:glycogen debranching enzyme family protein [Phycisphaerales bacterium]
MGDSADAAGLHLPRRVCADPVAALQREWLLTNGLGGFAFGTVAGGLTRRYHGWLIAALDPPLGRTLLAAKLDESVVTRQGPIPLYTNVWATGVEEPAGCRRLTRFDLAGAAAVWQFAVEGRTLTRRIWMEPGANITYAQYALAPSDAPLTLAVRLLANFRDYHALTPDDQRRFDVRLQNDVLHVAAQHAPAALQVRCAPGSAASAAQRAAWTLEQNWYRDFHLAVEQAVGYDHRDAHCCVATATVSVSAAAPVTFALAAVRSSPDSETGPGGGRSDAALTSPEALSAERISAAAGRAAAHVRQLLDRWRSLPDHCALDAPEALERLVLAADQFVVARATPDNPQGRTIIAGYPWFTDWGRDTMISLPGLLLCTGRMDEARRALLTWARHVDRGMIPNRFPDAGATPDFNTVDGTLWYLWAIDQYWRFTRDRATLAQLYPVACDIIDWHIRGTRYGIRVAADGLLQAGEPGVQLTWMDAKVDGRVITPRIGKPVEINALWHDALRNLALHARELGEPAAAERLTGQAEAAQRSFARFWDDERGWCRDVVDGPEGDDPRMQANQVFAVSLEHSPLEPEQRRRVVDGLGRRLLTAVGLRTLDPAEPRYHPRYEGRLVQRDEAYHQGTAWGWLLGPFVVAHHRVHGDRDAARRLLEPMLGQLLAHGVGSLSEIFDGDPPHTPRGCVAQAWSVAETLRAWHVTQRR